MRILYFHQYFKTPDEPGGTRSYWIARELIRVGHEVIIITSVNDGPSKISMKKIDGIQVIYIRIPYDQKMNISRRLFSFIRFMLGATWKALRIKDVDLVIATSTPLTIGFPALIMKGIKKTPYIFEVRDLWPEVPIQMGGLTYPFVKSLARWFEKMIYRNAVHVIALSPGMQKGVVKYIAEEQTSMIPNMAKVDDFWPRDRDIKLMMNLGLSRDSFKVIHFGSLGLANGAEYIIHAAKLMEGINDVQFLFAGGGSSEIALKHQSRSLNLHNTFFLGQFAMKDISEIVNFCDVSVVSFRNIPILYTNSPNKLFDSLSAGKPVIVNSAGWTRQLVEYHKCGLYVDPDDPQELVNAIIHLKNNPEIVAKMGNASRKLAEDQYDKSILCRKFVDKVDSLCINSHSND